MPDRIIRLTRERPGAPDMTLQGRILVPQHILVVLPEADVVVGDYLRNGAALWRVAARQAIQEGAQQVAWALELETIAQAG
ncbi:MAG: hypothetical protein DIU80_012930 [Chloroflexota bacterium]|nr:MAG: hypothetical protein DIU80_22155 [Chloroflexota bacterium]